MTRKYAMTRVTGEAASDNVLLRHVLDDLRYRVSPTAEELEDRSHDLLMVLMPKEYADKAYDVFTQVLSSPVEAYIRRVPYGENNQ